MIRDDIRNEIQYCITYNRGFKYLDKNTFVFEFGDGKFVDEDFAKWSCEASRKWNLFNLFKPNVYHCCYGDKDLYF